MKDARYNKLSAEGGTQPAPKARPNQRRRCDTINAEGATEGNQGHPDRQDARIPLVMDAAPNKADRKPDRFCRPFRAEYLSGARYGEAEPRRTSGGKAVSEMACWFTAKGNCVIKVSF